MSEFLHSAREIAMNIARDPKKAVPAGMAVAFTVASLALSLRDRQSPEVVLQAPGAVSSTVVPIPCPELDFDENGRISVHDFSRYSGLVRSGERQVDLRYIYSFQAYFTSECR